MINVVPSQKSQSLCIITDHSKSIAQTQYTPVMFPHSERQVAVVSVQEKDGGEENGHWHGKLDNLSGITW